MLYLLSKLKPLEVYYDTLQKRLTLYDKKDDKTIFDIAVFKPKETLSTNLTALADFNNAGDKKKAGNRIVFIKNSTIKIPWAVLRENWKKQVRTLAKEKGLTFKETIVKRVSENKRNRGLRL